MVQNRSFEDSEKDRPLDAGQPPLAWTLVQSPGAEGAMALDTSRPLCANNRHALRLDIVKTAGGRVGVANAGFCNGFKKSSQRFLANAQKNKPLEGIAVTKGQRYQLSLYARADAHFHGPLSVSVEDADGAVLAAGKTGPLTGDWKQYQVVLTAGKTEPVGRLVIAANAPGSLWLDMVSLFPCNTWKGRANGLRADLAEMLDHMQPAFVRFPGGCYVEGNKLANAFRWKDSIGDVAQRPGHWNLWGYRSSDGLGYHEYLQMCEDLKAEPLLVINCGMAHEDHVPLEQMHPWVQDALDAIEYANGPVQSRWGALRAKHGHAGSFHLKYLEIGNENGGVLYEERYPLFYNAIKAKYPQITLVADGRLRNQPMDVVDEHYYSSPEFFLRNAGKYDTYDRRGPKIYVGEYAVTQNCGLGNLRAAIGEAAFMIGMERNSDVVVMASYAPLLVNAAWRQWNPDAIVFDSSRACGTPSYHVQQMFGAHRGDVVLPVEVQSPMAADERPKSGMIGVGTWATQAEFKDLRVTQGEKTLFQSDFSKGLAGWHTIGGQWEAKDGVLRQTSPKTDIRAVVGNRRWSNYTLTLKARKLGGAEGFLVMFGVQDPRRKSWWNIGGWGNHHHALELPDGVMSDPVPGHIETGRWYDVRVELRGGAVRCYLDGKLIHDEPPPQLKVLYAGASRISPAGEVILKVVNAANTAQDAEINLRGAGPISPRATAIVLTAADPMEENTLEEPTKVVPVAKTIEDAGSSFHHRFPAQSVTILRLNVGGR
jgi:alpha-L-arabinofuranosidase